MGSPPSRLGGRARATASSRASLPERTHVDDQVLDDRQVPIAEITGTCPASTIGSIRSFARARPASIHPTRAADHHPAALPERERPVDLVAVMSRTSSRHAHSAPPPESRNSRSPPRRRSANLSATSIIRLPSRPASRYGHLALRRQLDVNGRPEVVEPFRRDDVDRLSLMASVNTARTCRTTPPSSTRRAPGTN